MSKVTLRVKIDKHLITNMVGKCRKKAVWSALDYLAAVSKQQVPLDQGPLMNSCYVDVAEDGSSGTVSYDTPYAVVQHECTWFQHQRGRKAKYLEDPVNDPTVKRNMEQISGQAFEAEMG